MSELNLADEIARFREKLLDLTNRNPLLNFRKSRTRTLQIVDELPDQIFSRLVSDGKRFRFAPIPEVVASADSAKTTNSYEHNAAIGPTNGDITELVTDWSLDPARHTDDKLQTNLSDAKLQSILKNIRRDAATAIEETGVNYLFLAIGQLTWKDAKDSERELLAPLILVPVRIERYFDGRSNKYEYAITWREEEIQGNLCLAKRLEKDFGLRIPAYEDEQKPTSYFEDVKRALSAQSDWKVSYELLLGFFSFQKLLMYTDIDPENWKSNGRLAENSVLGQVILGQSSHSTGSLYASDYEIDKDPASKKVLLATDADSSQHSALMDIATGKNLVIEGPPGTGKSQTITNAIATAIHDGKTVLFVAEKLAALEVVYSKLVELGLADFCLELHSDNASPRHVFEAFRSRLESSFQRPRQLEAIQEELEGKKQLIADYLKASNQIVGPFDEPLHALLWRVIDQRARGIQALRSAKCDCKISRTQFAEHAQQLEAFAESMLEIERPRKSPWWGFWPNRLNPNDCKPVRDRILRLSELVIDAGAASHEIDVLIAPATASWVAKNLAKQSSVQALRDLHFRATTFPAPLDIQCFLEASTRKIAKHLLELVRIAQGLKQKSTGRLLAPLETAVQSTRQLQVTLEK